MESAHQGGASWAGELGGLPQLRRVRGPAGVRGQWTEEQVLEGTEGGIWNGNMESGAV